MAQLIATRFSQRADRFCGRLRYTRDVLVVMVLLHGRCAVSAEREWATSRGRQRDILETDVFEVSFIFLSTRSSFTC
jgi:hypothetical protein